MPDSRLRNLELTGFKTFARRTEVILPGGVTGIVGPNGSGKSNLADALRWVLGEQSLQHIRSKKTEDVIFAGGANRAPLGAAEVVLTLDNTSGWIPLDFSEVTISRRAYRSGDNEYFINGSRVRLRDVIDLRNRAGFGQSSYSVIGQGLVDAVLSQRPEERRALIEEAAGIRHYQAKRDQTLDQLAATRQNLVRVQDIVAEIEPRVESLRKQSEKARQFTELTNELRTVQIRWYAARQRHLRRQSAEAESVLSEAQQALERASEGLRQLEAERAALDAERASAEQSLARENQRAAELRRRQEQLQGQLSLAKDKLQFMQQQSNDGERELAELAQAHATLAGQRSQLAAGSDELRQTEAQAAGELRAAEQAATARAAQARELGQRLQQARDQLAAASAALDHKRREAEQLDVRRGDLLRQAQQHDEDVGRKQGLVRALAEKQGDVQAELQRLRAHEEQLSGKTEELRLRASAAETAVAEAQLELDRLRRAHDELTTRHALLDELQSNLEGLADGARTLLRSGRPGVRASLAEGLKVSPGYERAIAAALGHKLDAVIVDGESAALEILAGDAVAEATLIVPGVPSGAPLSSAMRNGARTAQSVVTVGSEALALVLAGTTVVEDLQQALSEAKAGGRAVTLSGDIVEPDGTITRRGVSTGEAILKRQQALDDLASRITASEREIAASAEAHDRLAHEAATIAVQLKESEEEARRRSAVRQQQAGQLRDLAQQIQAAQAQIDWLASLKEQLAEQLGGLDLRRTALVAEMDQTAQQMPELEAQVTRRQGEAAELRKADEAESARVGELRLRRGITAQQLQHAQGQLDELDRQLLNSERQLAARQRRATEHAGTAGQLQVEIDILDRELCGVTRQLDEQQQLLPPLKNRLATQVEELQSLRSKETDAHERHSELDKRCYRLAFDSQRKREELDSLATSLFEELQLTPDLLPEPQADVTEPSRRDVDALKARLASLGPVNPTALEEFQEVHQRHQFLTTQKADLEQAAEQLQTVISELEELTTRQFLDTFDQVAQEFERFFGLMFNGGEVQMYLTDPGNVNATGIDIMAQPPGKRLQALPLLSGGERALVATALLFAILTAKPVPFCLLDEVDAALDEANVKRFCQALKSVAENTQFVVITHNRETMAIADALYGVSMSQDGVSRLVSLRLPREDTWGDSSLQDSTRLTESTPA